LARIAGAPVPGDRAIDGLDLSGFLFGETDRSPREGFVFYIKDQLRAIKWRHWKMHIIWEAEPNTGTVHLEVPYLFNVVQDPKEETDVNATQGWVRGPMRRLVRDFESSLAKFPRVPPGAPDDWTAA
jgi:arylsulfatase